MAIEFENFEVYKLSSNLTVEIYKLLQNEKLKHEFEFVNQTKRAIFSVTNNIAEGSEYNSNAQFVRFLKYSKGSCGEVRNMLNLCRLLFDIDTTTLILDCKVVSTQLSKFIDYLEKTDNKRKK